MNNKRRQLLIWDPITGERCRVSIPPLHSKNGEELSIGNGGAVRCVNGDQGHVHGHCYSGPLQVVLVVRPVGYYYREFVCVYSSATGTWSHSWTLRPSFFWLAPSLARPAASMDRAEFLLLDRSELGPSLARLGPARLARTFFLRIKRESIYGLK
jgi:hypothetical protein